MPKIRGFKSDLWTDEDFVELSPFARLLWLGMWNYACDNGHLADKSKQIKLRILPYDDVNAAELLREIEAQGLIARDSGTITIPNFVRHQKPDKRYWQTCGLAQCTKPSDDPERETRSAPTSPPRALAESTSGHTSPLGDGEVKGSDSDGESDGKRASRATQIPADWQPNEQHATFASENRLNLPGETDQFRDHHRAKGSTMKDWDAAFRTWLRNAVKFRGGPAQPLAVVSNPSQLPPVEDSWMRRRPR